MCSKHRQAGRYMSWGWDGNGMAVGKATLNPFSKLIMKRERERERERERDTTTVSLM